ncbi:biopolymer transporter ExbD [Spirochaetia bacterium]|nr:biopolymer transporter ExbD [Spirochaetia bacterium]
MNLQRKKKYFIVPLNSMSDVAFLLLIFIMLVSLINYRVEVKIDYPEAWAASKVSVDNNFEIWVDKSGQLFLAGIPSELGEIRDAIIEAYTTAPDTRIHIIADKNTPFEYVDPVLSMLQILQYRAVSFVVKDA